MKQFFYQRHCRFDINVKIIENHLAGGIDNHCPGRTARAIVAHDLWNAVGLLISGRMRHGDFQLIFELVFSKFIFGIDTESFKHRLNTHKYNIIALFKGLGQLFEGWKPNPLATRSPVLKEIQIDDLAAIVAQADGLDRTAATINPVGQIQLRRHLALDAVWRDGRCDWQFKWRIWTRKTDDP